MYAQTYLKIRKDTLFPNLAKGIPIQTWQVPKGKIDQVQPIDDGAGRL